MADAGSRAEAISAPAGTGNAPGLGEAFALDLNTGQAGYSVSLTLPEGTAGFSPKLQLQYHHGGGPSCFGLGWALPLRSIDRRLDYGVPGSPDGMAEIFTDGDRELVALDAISYAPRRESDFSRYRRVGAGWEVAERTGVVHSLGTDAAWRVADPDHPDRPISWLLERSVDPSGNTINYTWDIETGIPYLIAVSYAIYTITVRYGPRPDVVRSGRAGFGQVMSRRAEAIELHVSDSGTDRLVRRWSLSYEQAAFSAVSLLASVQLTSLGRAGDGSGDVVRPPQRFSYRQPDPAQWHAAFVPGVEGAYPPPLTDPRVLLTALGEGPSIGVLQAAGDRFMYWPGTGEGSFGAPRRLTEVPRISALRSPNVQMLDLDADTQTDMLVGSGTTDRVTGFYRGDGQGDLAEFVPYPRDRRGTPVQTAAATRLADLDGDGRVDVLGAAGRGYAWYRGAGAEGWDDPRLVTGPDADLGDPLVRMADMTGDGLCDLVRIRSGDVVYWPNLGAGRFGAPVHMAATPRLDAVSAPESLLLVDVDGDGCADLVRVDGTGVTVWPNRSGTMFGPPVLDPLVPPPISGTVVPAATTDDAAAGLVWCSRRAGATAYVRYDLGATAYQLIGVDNGAGLVSTIEYTTAAAQQRLDLAAGRRWTRPLPFPLVLVAATSEADTITGQRAESRYRYHDAYYDDRARTFEGFAEVEKTEIGDASRPDGRTVFFYRVAEDRLAGHGPQDAALNRMLRRVEVYGEDGSPQEDLPYLIEESTHAVSVLASGPDGRQRVLVTVMTSTRTTTERTADQRAETRAYTYDANGNVVQERLTYSGVLGGAAQPPQVITTDISYAVNPAINLLDRPARITHRDGNGVLLMETHRHYDGPDFAGLPLGHADRGLLTRETRWALTRTDFNTHYAGGDPASLGYQLDVDIDGRAGVFAPVERNRYDTQGRKTGRQSPTGTITSIGYDSTGLFRVSESNSLGTTTSEYDVVVGKATRITGQDGATVQMSYDAQGRLTAAALPGDELAFPTRSYEYDDSSLPNVVRMQLRLQSGGPEAATTAVYFDGRMREIQRRVEMAPGQVLVSGYAVRNPWGDSASEFEPTYATDFGFAIPTLDGRPSRQVSYDVLGRPLRTVDYGGGLSTVVYAPFSVETADANDNDTSPEHAGRGQAGTTRVDHSDVAQHRTSISEHGGAGPVTTTFVADPLGRLLAHGDDLGEVERSVFDGLGNRLQVHHREAGDRHCFFDAQNRMVRTIDGAGNDVTATFDEVDRITELQVGGVVRETYLYDDLASNGFGRLHAVSYPGGSQRFAYDIQGRTTTHVYRFDDLPTESVFTFGYDAQGRRTSVTYPDGATVSQELYANGVPRRVAGFVDLVEYDPRMLLSRITYANGVTTTVANTPGAGRVARQTVTGAGGAVLEDSVFEYDAMWRLLGVTQNNGTTNTYEYDPLYQLTKAVDTPSGGAAVQTDYSYTAGRLLAGNGETGLTLHYEDAAAPGRVSRASGNGPDLPIGYDGNGNMTALPGRSLTFGPKNELETVTKDDGTVITYTYDHTGARIRKQVRQGNNVTDTLLLGALAEVRNGQLAAYVVLGSSRIALTHMGSTMWIHTDPLGSATFYTDATATPIARIAYRPFGNANVLTGPAWAEVFALHEFDSDAGLYYMRRRWYAADLGCFISPDAVYLYKPERGADTPAALSLYTYVGNDPGNNVDPDGGSFWSVVGGIVGVIVGIVVAVVVIAAFASGIGFGLLALAGVILAVTGGYLLASANQGNSFGEFMKGFLIGFNAGMNAVLMTAIGGPILGLVVGVIGALAVFDGVRQNAVYQGILGWSNWLMPMSWLVLALGIVFFVLNVLGMVFTANQVDALKITYVHMDWSTGSIIMKGGWISNLNAFHTAFDMGNFIFVDRQNTAPDDDIPHEEGHSLSLGAFGSIVHFVGFVDEFFFAGGNAWTERMADSHSPTRRAALGADRDHTWG
jgi:RHS repeat-associated protein